MLIHPAAIVALLLYLVMGPLTATQQFQSRFKSLGYGLHRKISSVLSLPHGSFEVQDHPTVFEAIPVETNAVHPVQIFPSCPDDRVEVVIPEVCPTRYDNRSSPVPVLAFVMFPEYHGTFQWRDLFHTRVLRVLNILCAIYFSVWFPLVVVPRVAKLLSQSESPDEVGPAVDAQPIQLPIKVLTPPRTINIRTLIPKSHAPLEPIFSPTPPAPSTFWLASQQQQQAQPPPPSPPLLRLLDFSAFENGLEKKLSPLFSPADSGYGATLPDMTSDASSLGKSTTTSPERLAEFLPTACAESTFVDDSKNATTSENLAGKDINSTVIDIELEDDDDRSTTVTNSMVNLVVPSVPIPAEELVAKLGSGMATLVEEDEVIPGPPAEEPSVTLPPSDKLAADPPPHDKPMMDSPSNDEAVVDAETSVQEPAPEAIPADGRPPAVCVDQKIAAGTRSDIIVEEDELPTIIISPPSEVDPEDYAWQPYSEQEQEDTVNSDFEDKLEPGCEDPENEVGSELEYTDDYPASELPPSPVETEDGTCRSPFRSPITATGQLWTELEDNLGPLPFTEGVIHVEVFDNLEIDTLGPSDTGEIPEQPEAVGTLEQVGVIQVLVVEEGTLETVTATSEGLSVERPVVETSQELVEEPQLAPEVPVEEDTETIPTVPFPYPSPPRATRPHPIDTRPSFNRGSSWSGGTVRLPRPRYYNCCELFKSDGRPKSWKDWKLEKPEACIPRKTKLQEWQFVCPTDEDGKYPTTRIAIDNLDAHWFRTTEGTPSYNYLTEAMEFFSTKYFRCWTGRTINGVEYPSIGYATVDFDSLDEAIRMFDELQGRRFRGHTWHWRLEFVDPSDDTHGGRKIIRPGLVPNSVMEALAAELEASTRRHGRFEPSTDAPAVARPPARVRPQISVGGRSLFAGAMANVVQDRRAGEQPTQSTTPRRPYRARS